MKHHATIGDFKGLCQVLGSNSQSGTKPCPECRDIIDPFKSKDADLEGPGLVPFTSTEPNTWRKHDDASVRRLMDRLRDATRPRYKQLTTIHGYKYCKYNIINDPYLKYRPISTLLYDWQHVWCVGGVFERSMNALQDSLKGLVGCADFNEYFKAWIWPLQFPSAKAIFVSGRFIVNASLTLSCIPVMIRFLRDVVQPAANAAQQLAITSHVRACEVVRLLNSHRSGACTPDDLHIATMNFVTSHVEVHDYDYWVFKFHQALDLPKQFRRFQGGDPDIKVPNCFALERKHNIVKTHSRDRRNTTSIERGNSENIVLDHLHHWQEMFKVQGLVRPQPPSGTCLTTLQELYPHADNLMLASLFITPQGAQFHKGDFVLTADGDGQLWYHFRTGDTSEVLTCFVLIC